jgi:phenylpropionate dioxygenase-like ring-hydroxylating dioxygenase large terminal subunit
MKSKIWTENAWYVAAFSRELRGDTLLARKFLGVPVVMYRKTNGEVVALEDSCAHRRLPLSFGYIKNDEVVCGYHGMTFAPTGKCTHIPGQERIPAAACVKTFPLVERHKLLWIWMGDHALADESLIPAIRWMDDPDWVASDGYTPLKADYRLLIDNLLDLSHVAFVHGRTIGNVAVAESPIKVTEVDGVLKVHRDVIGAMPPPFFSYIGKYSKAIHRWHTVNYIRPSICAIDIGTSAMHEGDGRGTIAGCVLHLVTPETTESSHYFWAFMRNFAQDDDSLTAYIQDAVGRTHDEDKVVVELQHQALTADQRDNPVSVAIAADGGALRGRKMLGELLEQDFVGE